MAEQNIVERYQTLIGSVLAAAAALIAAVFAWQAAQQQIASGNDSTQQQLAKMQKQIEATQSQVDTAKKQIDASLDIAAYQIAEARTQHRIEYLRQYLPQLEAANVWLKEAAAYRIDTFIYHTASEAERDAMLKQLDQHIAFFNTMPPIPLYDGDRPSDHRDKLVHALRDYEDEVKGDVGKDDSEHRDRVDKAKRAVTDADGWYVEQGRIEGMESEASNELAALEKEIARPRR